MLIGNQKYSPLIYCGNHIFSRYPALSPNFHTFREDALRGSVLSSKKMAQKGPWGSAIARNEISIQLQGIYSSPKIVLIRSSTAFYRYREIDIHETENLEKYSISRFSVLGIAQQILESKSKNIMNNFSGLKYSRKKSKKIGL